MTMQVHVVACVECGDQYITTEFDRAHRVLEGMKHRGGEGYRMHGNGRAGHSHDGLSVVTYDSEAGFPVRP